MIQTRDQKYSAQIFEQVMDVTGNQDADFQAKYRSLVQSFPILLRKAGLAQALAFVEERGDIGQQILLFHLAEVVLPGRVEEVMPENGAEAAARMKRLRQNLLEESRKSGPNALERYMDLTERVLAALRWYKHFAEAFLDDRADGYSGGSLNTAEAARGAAE